jgi:hypothetical protein
MKPSSGHARRSGVVEVSSGIVILSQSHPCQFNVASERPKKLYAYISLEDSAQRGKMTPS